MLKRPTSKDTEEDLLRQQEEFLKSNSKPSVTLVSTGGKRKNPDIISTAKEKVEVGQAEKDVVTLGGELKHFAHV